MIFKVSHYNDFRLKKQKGVALKTDNKEENDLSKETETRKSFRRKYVM